MGERCNKCRISNRVSGDTWCIGCSAWESVGRILTSKWEGPAGLKSIADNLVVDCARQLHALRSLGAGHRPAPKAPSSGPLVAVKEEVQEKSVARTKETPGLAAKSKAVPLEAEKSEYSYLEGEESEESEVRLAGDPRPSLPRHRSTPSEPVVAGESREVGSRRSRPSGAEVHREDRRETEESRRSSREELDRGEVKRKRERSREKDKKRKDDKAGKKGKRKRGGRKHQRLGRLLEDPYKAHHRKLSDSFLRERPDWADAESRARRSH